MQRDSSGSKAGMTLIAMLHDHIAPTASDFLVVWNPELKIAKQSRVRPTRDQ
jgi:hypothetical protein